MKATGDVPEVAVMVDGPAYNIEWPSHWHIHNSFGHLEMQRALNALLPIYPKEPFYGILTDTHRPQTPEWSSKMVKAMLCPLASRRSRLASAANRLIRFCDAPYQIKRTGSAWVCLRCMGY